MADLHRNDPCPHCGRFANRGVSIDAVIEREGSVLLVERAREPDKGAWATPGGYVDWDETIEDAVRREVLEETGLVSEELELLAVRSDPARHPKQVINFVYLVRAGSGEAVAGDDAADVAWFPLEEVPARMALDHHLNVELARKALAKR